MPSYFCTLCNLPVGPPAKLSDYLTENRAAKLNKVSKNLAHYFFSCYIAYIRSPLLQSKEPLRRRRE